MQYGGLLDPFTLMMATILTLQWALPVAIALVIAGFFNRPRRSLFLKLALAWTVLVFIGVEYGLDICNTTNSCPLDSIPSFFD
jgi:hypothetical protein